MSAPGTRTIYKRNEQGDIVESYTEAVPPKRYREFRHVSCKTYADDPPTCCGCDRPANNRIGGELVDVDDPGSFLCYGCLLRAQRDGRLTEVGDVYRVRNVEQKG
jgi:hypothetical protein